MPDSVARRRRSGPERAGLIGMTRQTAAADHRDPWDPDPLGAGALLILTAVAGGLDAIAFLALGGTFVSNQTGTVLLLAMGASGTAAVEVAAAITSLASFVVGAALAGRVLPARAPGEPWPRRTRTVLILEVVLIAIAAAMSGSSDLEKAFIVAPMALAMGAQAALAKRIALPYLTTGFITGATIGAAVGSPLGDRSARWWWFGLIPVVVLAVGAGVGSLLDAASTSLALGAFAVFVLAASGLTVLHARRPLASGRTAG
jgi:uncharacterized membrane protein YoaK (UPF0700 family)